MERIRYRCLILIVNENIKYWAVRISSDKDMGVMFRIYWQYIQHISAIELYVDFEKVVVAQVDTSSYMVSQHHDETIFSSYPVSHDIFCKIFLFQS